jgi:serine/threonine-protein phosphatase 4 catalytic subunit
MEKLIAQLQKLELPTETEINLLFKKAEEILIEEPNTIILYPPISICGDIHGQFYDLLELFEHGDYCPETSYVFMGDLLDRGYHGIEVFLYLIAIKVRYPTKMTLLRGNHESRTATQYYGFYEECKKKFGTDDVYKWCMNICDLLPISAVISQQLFLVHGGLSPNLNGIDELYHLNRKQEIAREGIISDMLWSDPDDKVNDWAKSERGAGYLFGTLQAQKFNHINNFNCIMRSHQLVQDGYEYLLEGNVCTVWSAPNYCYRCGNVGTILEIDEYMNRNFNIFEESPDFIRKDVGEIDSRPAYFL